MTLAGERKSVNLPGVVPGAVRYGGMTMAAVLFANLLQQGELQSFSQAADDIRRALHVTDFQLGFLSFLTGVAGAFGALWISHLCARHARTRVLAGMFAVWAMLMILIGLAGPVSLSFLGLHLGFSAFVVFAFVKLITSVSEATDPAAYPLISDYWPVEQRAAKVSIFNAGSAVGGLLGLVAGGVLVDNYGWQWAFFAWVPLGLVGSVLMMTRREPRRGLQDAAFRDELATLSEEAKLAEIQAEERLITSPGLPIARWPVLKELLGLRTWRVAAIGFGIAQILTTALQFWGAPYFKRTFALSGTEVAGLAPLIGSGAFVGLLGGGFLADRLLRRGVVRARVYVSGCAYLVAFVAMVAAFTSRTLPVAGPLLFLGTVASATPIGPVWALQLDVTPARLRPQAMAVSDILQLVNALGYLIVGGLSDVIGNLRIALLLATPACAIGGLMVLFLAGRTYVEDVAMVVADAEQQIASGNGASSPL